MQATDPAPSTAAFRLAYVPGVTPTKWLRVWAERLPDVPLTLVQVGSTEGGAALVAGEADAGLVRLPVDRTVLSAIPLYTETTVIVLPKDHLLTALDEVTVADLAEEVLWQPLDDTLDWAERPGTPAYERPETTAGAIELVAAGVGLLPVPQSLARLHHRRDLTFRPLVGVPQSQIALAWPEAATTELVEEFIGIVRGRTANSSRGRAKEEPKPAAAPKAKKPQQKGQAAGQGVRAKQGGKPGAKSGAKAAPAKRGRPGRRAR
ncbi:LysR family transcriptional regulator [Streptomyces tateyamensis]|uniref:LysR family transcriptional regulator n=1 Tax=Streptomyces tateyamensis TaxID=565073 RepID=A0A2V4NM46_9ACTN|nr:LysR family substrate-binding domain-containing protein [Streptomyces tateyamensis]PYC76698.1 LysR family transcriptional regulator [Streptomyces tateyamensis]